MKTIRRSWFSWLWRFVLGGLSYVFFYYFFGAINFMLVTGPYYKTHAGWSSRRRPSFSKQKSFARADRDFRCSLPAQLSGEQEAHDVVARFDPLRGRRCHATAGAGWVTSLRCPCCQRCGNFLAKFFHWRCDRKVEAC